MQLVQNSNRKNAVSYGKLSYHHQIGPLRGNVLVRLQEEQKKCPLVFMPEDNILIRNSVFISVSRYNTNNKERGTKRHGYTRANATSHVLLTCNGNPPI